MAAFDYATVQSAVQDAAERTRGMIALADALKGIVSIDGAASEAQARLDAARAGEAQAKSDLLAIQNQVAAAQESATGAIAAAQTNADAIVAAAKADADATVAQANSVASDAITQANANATTIVVQARAAAQVSVQAKADADAAVAAAQALLVSTNDQLAVVQAKLDAANASIASLLAHSGN